jgi:hypothetical protein
LLEWTGYGNRSYFFQLLRQMRGKRLIELSANDEHALILPPGNNEAAKIVRKQTP